MRLTRITLAIIALIILAGFNLLVRKQLAEVEPQLFQATEEAMVDAANIMAVFAEREFTDGAFDAYRFREVMEEVHGKELRAEIFNHSKEDVGMDFYVTNAEGIVLFDSGFPEREGEDFSEQNDVYLTLSGKYGARSSRMVEDDDTSSVLYVAAPIGDSQRPIGVLTAYKPQADVLPIIRRRFSEIWWGTGLVGGGILFCVGVVFIWQYLPISKLTEYARDIEKGKRTPLPYLGLGKEVNTLARALESMRESLEGRRFAERYVQTLTHEMKSPLAAIRGASELLDEDAETMSLEDRRRFLGNISAETLRADRLLGKLLELSVLEGKAELDVAEDTDLGGIVERVVSESGAMADLSKVTLSLLDVGNRKVRGDAFILKAAVTNLLENAIDFSPEGGVVSVKVETVGGYHRVVVEDEGEGIPEYAKEKVFDRFFSLRHLRKGRKGTGLGLTLVKEAAELHQGKVSLEANEPKGTRAVLEIPVG
ncbi:MAG: two-component system sensor histidine kinase CreC [Akkermansiaceae bacterium]|jgi:two-component system, OmpR family, sensor histidine kinase CreC|nr:two-component system sensor histidine kinase CreC [Akkermansiaceae bacterium]MDP4647414.1 two-component system sensor histidine kinase CreC [Akkermansiaceae bacterium]MDP4721233.1 two-component system sensor histidine kinase CreC [Akkermansiaceae bacterium]MDP4781559.1 two-component system sensor histidine kinase CreC [Akkermansiaceae bacterium]MDP4848020.1 two-component system sensor histidine kinase CreC [Akkermansiaceae bacterium]